MRQLLPQCVVKIRAEDVHKQIEHKTVGPAQVYGRWEDEEIHSGEGQRDENQEAVGLQWDLFREGLEARQGALCREDEERQEAEGHHPY